LGQEAFDALRAEELAPILSEAVKAAHQEKRKAFAEGELAQLERYIILQIIDHQWVNHLQDMEQMKEGIGLRGYGQMDPLKEYQKEGFSLFGSFMERIREETLGTLFRLQLVRQTPQEFPRRKRKPLQMSHGGEEAKPATVRRQGQKIGRNSPCPCGSGKKYKKCCGADA
jgi:preprotein translocase subunit SecA